MTEPSNPFENADVISVYTAEDGIEDGILVHFSPATALEAGYRIPVLLTRAAYDAAVQWTRGESWQSEDARFWDVLTVIRPAARAVASDGTPRETYVLRVPDTTPSGKPSRSTTATKQPLRVSVEGFNLTGQACIIVALPGED